MGDTKLILAGSNRMIAMPGSSHVGEIVHMLTSHHRRRGEPIPEMNNI